MNIDPSKDVIKFQIIDWYTQNMVYVDEDNESNDESDSSSFRKSQLDESEYKIMIFGKDNQERTYYRNWRNRFYWSLFY